MAEYKQPQRACPSCWACALCAACGPSPAVATMSIALATLVVIYG